MIAIRVCRRCGKKFDAIVGKDKSVYCAACNELAELEADFAAEQQDAPQNEGTAPDFSRFKNKTPPRDSKSSDEEDIEKLVLQNIRNGKILGTKDVNSISSMSRKSSRAKQVSSDSWLNDDGLDEILKLFR